MSPRRSSSWRTKTLRSTFRLSVAASRSKAKEPKLPGFFRLPWISRCSRTAYWGDIDAAGFAIVNDLRIAGIHVQTILMDYATFEEYEQYGAWTGEKGKPVPCSPRRQLPALTPDERDLYQLLTDPAWTRVRRIEQERIPLRLGAERLYALVAK